MWRIEAEALTRRQCSVWRRSCERTT